MRRKTAEPGEQFNEWTIVETRGTNRHNMTMVLARCSCGNEREVIFANLRAGVSRKCRACALQGQDWTAFHENSPTGKRNKGDYIIEIKRRLSVGHTRGQIARDYGLTYDTVNNIYHERSWKRVPWPNNWSPPWKVKPRKAR